MRSHRALWKLLALLLSFTLIAAACGGDDDDDGGDAGGDTDTETTEAEGEDGEGGPTSGTEIVFAAEQEPTNLNWLTAADNAAWTQYIMSLVWPGAIYGGTDGELVQNEDLVTSIELTSEDPQVVTYEINPDANWSDGEPITADDFAFMWEAQRDAESAYAPAGTNGYELIESVEGSEDGKTVTVTFTEPYADWRALFDYVFPRHAFEAAGDGDPAVAWTESFKPENLDPAEVISGGPYLVESYDQGQSVVLVRNEDYFGEPAATERLVFPFITDAAQQPQALANGEINGGFPQAQLDLLQQVEGIDNAEFEIGFGTFWEHLDFNLENPILAELEVRQAIALGLDRAGIVERIPGQFSDEVEVLNNRVFFPGGANYVDNAGEFATQDQDAAREALESAGWTEGSDGVYEKDGQRLSLRITWRDPNPRREQTAQLIQDQLSAVGFEIELAPQPDFNFLDEGNFDIALFGWTGGLTLGSQRSLYTSGEGQNFAKYSNEEVDSLLAEADVTLDEDARVDLYNQVDTILWEDLPTLPLFQNPEIIMWTDDVSGVQYNGYQGPTWNAPTWTIQ
ncbi:ABC transporter family substrate-binding protein [Actinomarinicola tropica]|uniref:Solute-binding protein family 5 domain-containing protein n=1 Tax=Actinomarinicola tropica TaxID=2789776 RepID=A0A5Q2RKK7_9ACTN|nr:ABC transporter family substrate-binding protein [Actinomarinicola tropica]QGG95452.1 hypothetical protein GH723_10280 [Actinomarinicola tropica]